MSSVAANPQLDISLGLRGFQRARILRAMLALGTFTRKDLAAAAGVAVDAAGTLILRHKDWFIKKGFRRSGRQGPPEEWISLHPDKEQALLQELEPLYKDLASEGEINEEKPGSYTPNSIEYLLASNMVSSLPEGSSLPPEQFRRAVKLLETASEKEGLPLSEHLEGYLSENPETAPAIQRVAKAHLDVVRAKLCLSSVPQTLSGEPENAFQFHRLVQLGFGFLEFAGRSLLEAGAVQKVRDLDNWTGQHVSPLFERLKSDPVLQRSEITAKILEPLRSPELRKIVPDFMAKFAPRRIEILEDPELPRRGGRIPYTIVEVNPFSSVPEVCTATRKFRNRPIGGGITVWANSSTIVDGLVSLYCTNYRPSADKISALVNIRRNEVHVAILKGRSLVFSRKIATPMFAGSHVEKVMRPHFFLSERRERVSVKILGELRKSLEFFSSTSDGQNVSEVFVTGERVLAEELKKAIPVKLRIPAHDFNPSSHLHLNMPGFSAEQCVIRGRRLAPEIGIALKEWKAHNVKIFSEE